MRSARRREPRVVNVMTASVAGSYVLVDRTTRWGNRHRCGPGAGRSRDEAIRRHRVDVAAALDDPEYRRDLEADLAGRDVGCHCAPLPCHGRTLIAAANSLDVLS